MPFRSSLTPYLTYDRLGNGIGNDPHLSFSSSMQSEGFELLWDVGQLNAKTKSKPHSGIPLLYFALFPSCLSLSLRRKNEGLYEFKATVKLNFNCVTTSQGRQAQEGVHTEGRREREAEREGGIKGQILESGAARAR